MKEFNGKLKRVLHCAVFGRLEDVVRKVKVSNPGPHAQYRASVWVNCVKAGRRKSVDVVMVPDDIRYCTVEDESGRVLYDSRQDVPCDMAKWEATRRRFENNPPVKTVTG
jgi:hypothetical protein